MIIILPNETFQLLPFYDNHFIFVNKYKAHINDDNYIYKKIYYNLLKYINVYLETQFLISKQK